MKKTLPLLFLLIHFSFYAQNDSNWNIGVEYSIDDLSVSDDRNGIDYLITDGNINGYAIEWNKSNYSFGLTTNYMILEKFSLSSGILYSNKDFIGTYNCATCDFFESFPETIEQRFITLPISIDYTILSGKLKPILKGGFKNNLEIKNDLEEKSKGYFLEAFIGASVYYGFSENWNAGIGYNYQTALSDLYETDEFNLRTNSFFLQINYNLK